MDWFRWFVSGFLISRISYIGVVGIYSRVFIFVWVRRFLGGYKINGSWEGRRFCWVFVYGVLDFWSWGYEFFWRSYIW